MLYHIHIYATGDRPGIDNCYFYGHRIETESSGSQDTLLRSFRDENNDDKNQRLNTVCCIHS